MPFKLIFQLSTRNVWRQKRRNLIMLSAIVIAIAGVFSMNTLARGMTGDIISMALDNLTGHIKVLASGYLDNPGIENSFIARNEEMAAQGLVDVQGWGQPNCGSKCCYERTEHSGYSARWYQSGR